MKKILLSLSMFLLVSGAAIAQDDNRPVGTSTKNGQNILPAAGDVAIGIGASPFLDYLGNSFNGHMGNTAPQFEGYRGSIYGKYFLTDQSAVRLKLNFDFGSDENTAAVTNDTEVAMNPINPFATTLDLQKLQTNQFDLSVGYEIRRGYGRLQGFIGAEATVGFGSSSVKYTRGNEMTYLNQTPTTWDFENPGEINPDYRLTKAKGGAEYKVGVGGFIGVEYFFAPKISIGGEAGISFLHEKSKLGESTLEYFDASSSSVKTASSRIGQTGYSRTHFQTLTSGSLFVMFHF